MLTPTHRDSRLPRWTRIHNPGSRYRSPGSSGGSVRDGLLISAVHPLGWAMNARHEVHPVESEFAGLSEIVLRGEVRGVQVS